MTSLHYITHAVTLAVIATLVKKYLQLKYAYEDLELSKRSFRDTGHSQGGQDQRELIEKAPDDVSTSLWCAGQNRSDRMCKFENLCYNTKMNDFVFIRSERNIVDGVDIDSVHQGLLELSTVADHNVYFFQAVDLTSQSLQDFSVHWIREESLLFSRFKPDNVMHVFHDDIFPLHHTLKLINLGHNDSEPPYNTNIVLLDDWESDELVSLYSRFSSRKLITKLDLQSHGEVVCFQSGHVGLSKTTTWYQYGFKTPQGPLPGSSVNGMHIYSSVSYLIGTSPGADESSGNYLVLLSRKDNRRILNEGELVTSIAKNTGMTIFSVSFETHSIDDMMTIVHGSKGVIGMHGSLMILAAFLNPSSVVLELFPFAINPENYTPFKTLTEIQGMNLVYKSWVNRDRERTVMHSRALKEFGGLEHLPGEEQEKIIEEVEVPLHLCCDDPSWLFHIYQDTIVDIPTVIALLREALSEASHVTVQHHPVLIPGPVRHITCDVDVQRHRITLSWERPWNLKSLLYRKLEYEVWLQNTGTEGTLAVIVDNVLSYDIADHVTAGVTYNVWMRSLLDEQVKGQFSSAIQC